MLERLDAALNHHPPGVEYQCVLDGDAVAKLTMIACSTPPEGRDRRLVQLLADHLKVVEVIDSISSSTVQPRLEIEVELWLSASCYIFSHEDLSFAAAMVDVLKVLKWHFDSRCLVVCLDEQPKQIIGAS